MNNDQLHAGTTTAEERRTLAIVTTAIAQNRSIEATYDGYERVLSPHVVGTKRGWLQALFLQTGGGSKSGLSTNLENNWRCIRLARLSNVKESDAAWQTAGNHSQQQTCVGADTVIAVVDY